ncbi:hypothetical protein GCM10027321_20310 [Massilia terrae]|uniref:SPOR domain-containing protein n=1 Tax=Massilia terrae TaxID=1811224 RepID=A0ABT2CVF9_9BURK|nr:SPOR domain-containing protein [Massilia terrae]MCS0657961.1 SPOR domain-containing protein [Massilia terrae]
MGLFSFLSKNKQDSSANVSGRFSRPDDEFAERARAKRASHAGGGGARRPDDPMLPEKKRARRRLVGAVALALAAAIGLPMLLDSEPKPLAGDVDIQIPAKDKAGPLPMPAAPGSAPESVPAAAPAAAPASVAASQSVDKGEEIIAPPPARPAAPSPADSARKVVAVQAAPEKIEPPKPVEHKAELARVEAPKPEHKDKPKPEPKAAPKKEEKPHVEDAARAMAILEGKEAAKPHEAAGDKVVLQVAALGTPEKVAELQAKLREAGIRSFTEKYQNLIRVKVGPYSRDEAEKVRAQLSKLGLSGKLQPA